MRVIVLPFHRAIRAVKGHVVEAPNAQLLLLPRHEALLLPAHVHVRVLCQRGGFPARLGNLPKKVLEGREAIPRLQATGPVVVVLGVGREGVVDALDTAELLLGGRLPYCDALCCAVLCCNLPHNKVTRRHALLTK